LRGRDLLINLKGRVQEKDNFDLSGQITILSKQESVSETISFFSGMGVGWCGLYSPCQFQILWQFFSFYISIGVLCIHNSFVNCVKEMLLLIKATA
jgi:hypothetical protein